MSRHVLDAERRVVVGWDQPMQAFFAQEFGAGEDAPATWWVGTRFREIYELEQLRARVPLAIRRQLTPHVERVLFADRDEGR